MMKRITQREWIFISIAILIGLYYWVFYYYPSLIVTILYNLDCGYNPMNDKLTRGTFGDMYGALNTLFSALAFIGLLATIFVQIYLHNREIENEKMKEIKKEQDMVIYLQNLVSTSISVSESLIAMLNQIAIEFKKNPISYPSLPILTNFENIKIIVEKIDQASYFTAYINQFDRNTDILRVYNLFNFIYTTERVLREDYQSKIEKSIERQRKYGEYYKKIFIEIDLSRTNTSNKKIEDLLEKENQLSKDDIKGKHELIKEIVSNFLQLNINIDLKILNSSYDELLFHSDDVVEKLTNPVQELRNIIIELKSFEATLLTKVRSYDAKN